MTPSNIGPARKDVVVHPVFNFFAQPLGVVARIVVDRLFAALVGGAARVDHMQQHVCSSQIVQKLVSQTQTLRGTRNKLSLLVNRFCRKKKKNPPVSLTPATSRTLTGMRRVPFKHDPYLGLHSACFLNCTQGQTLSKNETPTFQLLIKQEQRPNKTSQTFGSMVTNGLCNQTSNKRKCSFYVYLSPTSAFALVETFRKLLFPTFGAPNTPSVKPSKFILQKK